MFESTTTNFEDTTLPQFGFGPDCTFSSLVTHNPFLFRIHTPKAHASSSSTYTEDDAYFIGNRFNQDIRQHPDPVPAGPYEGTYADVAMHMDWTTRPTSPLISASFSVVWAVWEATRRYRSQSSKHDVHIAVIDARALVGHAHTALELLRLGSTRERTKDYWKWHKFAVESQEVLVHGIIPSSAVLASIPLDSLIGKFPSYFLDPSIRTSSPLDRLAWDYTEPKQSYRYFCTSMSDRFLDLSAEARLCETTAGSVRLAMALLESDEDLDTTRMCELAFGLAQWPAQWWARDHTEIRGVIYAMVDVLAEQRLQGTLQQVEDEGEVLEELERLQRVVATLQRTVSDYATKDQKQKKQSGQKSVVEVRNMPSTPPTTPRLRGHSRSDSPPASPSPTVHNLERIAVEDDNKERHPWSVIPGMTSPLTPPPTPPPTPASKATSPSTVEPGVSVGRFPFDTELETKKDVFQEEEKAETKVEVVQVEEEPSTPWLLVSPPSPYSSIEEPLPPSPTELESLWDAPRLDTASLWNTPAIPASARLSDRRPQRVGDTVSCLVTGLLLGAFVTLMAVSGQRRYIITNLT